MLMGFFYMRNCFCINFYSGKYEKHILSLFLNNNFKTTINIYQFTFEIIYLYKTDIKNIYKQSKIILLY